MLYEVITEPAQSGHGGDLDAVGAHAVPAGRLLADHRVAAGVAQVLLPAGAPLAAAALV